MSFPRILLLTWWRPTGKYAGGEVLRRVVSALPGDSIRWAYLLPGQEDQVSAYLPVCKSFALNKLHWRLEQSILRYVMINYFCTGSIVDRIMDWVKPFNPQLIWIASDMEAISVGLQLKKKLRLPLHITVYDAYECSCVSTLHPSLLFDSYLSRVRDVLGTANSFDAVSQELMDYINVSYPAKTSRRSLVFPPPVSMRPAVNDYSTGCRLTGRMRRIGFCGSSRTSDWQWQIFLDLLGRMDFDFELIVYASMEYFSHGIFPENVKLKLMPYVETEKELLDGFRENGVCACYLGLWREKDKELFVQTSLSSKLATYAAAGLPVIVDAPEDSVAWRLIKEYGAGVRLAGRAKYGAESMVQGGEQEERLGDKEILRRLFTDEIEWTKMAQGAGRMCYEKFDLGKNIEGLKRVFCETVQKREREQEIVEHFWK